MALLTIGDAQNILNAMDESASGNDLHAVSPYLEKRRDGIARTPDERMTERFLSRLSGSTVTFSFDDLPGIGSVADVTFTRFGTPEDSGWADGVSRGFTVIGREQVMVRFDWANYMVTFFVEQDARTYQIADMRHMGVGLLGDGTAALELYFDVQLRPLDSFESVVRWDLMTNKSYILTGVVYQLNETAGAANPSVKVTVRDVVEWTGVPQSVVSMLKNGKKDIDNLATSTFRLLSRFGQLVHMDGMMVAAWTGERNMVPSFGYEVKLLNGVTYTGKADAAQFADIVDVLDSAARVLTLKQVQDADGIEYDTVVVPVSGVQAIHRV